MLLAAGDTFRAAAREQLKIWGERNNVTVIAQDKGDPAAVIFDAIQAAKARGIDIVLADTAGRLPTQLHLMEEINKVKRVIAEGRPGRPARGAAGARRQHRPERACSPGQGLRRGARRHRAGADQARRHRQGRRHRRDRPPVPDADALHRRRRTDRRSAAVRRTGISSTPCSNDRLPAT